MEPLDRLLNGPLEIDVFLRTAIGIARAVGQLHEQGVIHKDIKPANVLVDVSRGGAHLTGFGFASRLTREQQNPDPPQVIAGSLAYMAPEQTGRMNRSIDARSDLYSLGVTFYEMLTGVLPFTASDPLEWVHCHIARQAIAPDKRNTAVPAQLSAIVMKLMAKTADERYQTGAGVEADLRECLSQWQARGAVEPFPLGTKDTSGRLLMPEKLYGRTREIESLLAAVDRVVAGGALELVLVSGYAGTGKSAVVNELHKALVPSRGLFASGKFDQYKRDIPYATLGQAFQSLVRGLLAQSETELARWSEALRAALGSNGQLVIHLVPELELVIGPQPPLSDLSALDAKHRFQAVLQAFLGVFAREEHPLTLFLDDLQWIDAATLDLLEELAVRSEARHLMLIGAYRDNEVDCAHPLMRTLDGIRKSGASVQTIVLAPLSTDEVGKLLADCLRCEPQRVASLADLIRTKTEGNPFFAIQFIVSLAEEGLLTFDRREARWTWDTDRIHAKGYSDNVADLMVAKLNRLPARSRRALQHLACLGNSVEFDQLSILYGDSRDAMHGDLQDAVRNGLVLASGRAYTFLHDRVQEAAYSSIPEAERAAAHLRIGRLLVARTAPDGIEDSVFEIVSQLNRGAHLIEQEEERALVAGLNLIAGRRAKAAVAHAAALTYLVAGLSLLREEDWQRRYRLVFELELNRAHCEFLSQEVDLAEERLAALAERATDLADLASVILVQTGLYTVQGQTHRAVEICLAYLRRIDVAWSAHPTDEVVLEEHERLRRHINGRDIETFIHLPRMADPDVRRVMQILGALSVPANLFNTRLMDLLVLRIANLSLEYGLTDESCIAFTFMTLVLGPRFGDYHSGYRFAQLSVELVDRLGLERYKTRVYCAYGSLVSPWLKPLRESYAFAMRACEAGPANGDLTWSAFAWRGKVICRFLCGDPLDEVQAEAERSLAFVRKVQFPYAINLLTLQRRFIRMLRGLTPSFATFNDEDFDEGRFEQTLETSSRTRYDDVKYWMMKAQIRFLADDPASALPAVKKAEAMPEVTLPTMEYAVFTLFAALSHAACGHMAEVAAYHQRLIAWAQDCPENFRNCEALVGAELARAEGRVADAEYLYDEAVRSARENGFVQNEGVALELAARFYGARGLETVRDAFLRNARACYVRWGAYGKVRHFDRAYPHLEPERPVGAPVEQLDLSTVVKVSQAVSGEIEFNRLIETLMVTALEHAGAGRGLLILPRADGLWIAAEAITASQSVDVRRTTRIRVNAAALPESVLHYVVRTRDSVLLHEAADQEPFCADEYIRTNASRSILCLPLIKQGELIGVLYLENSLASHVFTPARISILRLLASQAATSLDNARLYSELQDALTAFKESQERLRKAQAELSDIGRQTEMGELASLIVHEVTQPLAAIVTNADSCLLWLAKDEPNVEKARKVAERIVKNGHRAADLIRSIRARARKGPVEAIPLDLNRLIEDTLELLQPELQRREVSLESCFCDRPALVKGDPTQLQQVVVNLVTNAIEAIASSNRPMRTVRLRTEPDHNGSILTSVEDSGSGIDGAVLERIFDPMFTTKQQGMGLGLSICRSIVESHGGRLWVAPNPTGGSIFRFSLPTNL
jgi:predicted ATPase/signal transduction histidine kinase